MSPRKATAEPCRSRAARAGSGSAAAARSRSRTTTSRGRCRRWAAAPASGRRAEDHAAGWPWLGLARPASTCHGAAITRKTASELHGLSCASLVQAPRSPRVTSRERRDDGEREHNPDQPLGKHVERARGGKAPAQRARRRRLRLPLFRTPEAVKRAGEQHADQHVGDVDAREDEDAEARKRDRSGVQSGPRAEQPAARTPPPAGPARPPQAPAAGVRPRRKRPTSFIASAIDQ